MFDSARGESEPIRAVGLFDLPCSGHARPRRNPHPVRGLYRCPRSSPHSGTASTCRRISAQRLNARCQNRTGSHAWSSLTAPRAARRAWRVPGGCAPSTICATCAVTSGHSLVGKTSRAPRRFRIASSPVPAIKRRARWHPATIPCRCGWTTIWQHTRTGTCANTRSVAFISSNVLGARAADPGAPTTLHTHHNTDIAPVAAGRTACLSRANLELLS